MTSTQCRRIRREFGAFVDGELPGATMLRVSQHLEACAACSDEVKALRGIGDLMREAAADSSALVEDLGGLAGGVVSRVRAEQAQSWLAVFGRLSEDWHWVVVGAGSVTATFLSALIVSGLILIAPKPEREDSLAAMLNNMGSRAGTLFVVATPVGRDRDSVVMQFDNGETSPTPRTSVVPAQILLPSDIELVQWLDTLIRPDGRLVDVRKLSASDRSRLEGLLEEIRRRLRSSEPTRGSDGLVVHRIELVTNTSVTAKPL